MSEDTFNDLKQAQEKIIDLECERDILKQNNDANQRKITKLKNYYDNLIQNLRDDNELKIRELKSENEKLKKENISLKLNRSIHESNINKESLQSLTDLLASFSSSLSSPSTNSDLIVPNKNSHNKNTEKIVEKPIKVSKQSRSIHNISEETPFSNSDSSVTVSLKPSLKPLLSKTKQVNISSIQPLSSNPKMITNTKNSDLNENISNNLLKPIGTDKVTQNMVSSFSIFSFQSPNVSNKTDNTKNSTDTNDSLTSTNQLINNNKDEISITQSNHNSISTVNSIPVSSLSSKNRSPSNILPLTSSSPSLHMSPSVSFQSNPILSLSSSTSSSTSSDNDEYILSSTNNKRKYSDIISSISTPVTQDTLLNTMQSLKRNNEVIELYKKDYNELIPILINHMKNSTLSSYMLTDYIPSIYSRTQHISMIYLLLHAYISLTYNQYTSLSSFLSIKDSLSSLCITIASFIMASSYTDMQLLKQIIDSLNEMILSQPPEAHQLTFFLCYLYFTILKQYQKQEDAVLFLYVIFLQIDIPPYPQFAAFNQVFSDYYISDNVLLLTYLSISKIMIKNIKKWPLFEDYVVLLKPSKRVSKIYVLSDIQLFQKLEDLLKTPYNELYIDTISYICKSIVLWCKVQGGIYTIDFIQHYILNYMPTLPLTENPSWAHHLGLLFLDLFYVNCLGELDNMNSFIKTFLDDYPFMKQYESQYPELFSLLNEE
ncbi:hypothetical protein WA158_001178 [Blastocystis sp. Blastoise]